MRVSKEGRLLSHSGARQGLCEARGLLRAGGDRKELSSQKFSAKNSNLLPNNIAPIHIGKHIFQMKENICPKQE